MRGEIFYGCNGVATYITNGTNGRDGANGLFCILLKKVDTERKVNDVPITHRKATQVFCGSDTAALRGRLPVAADVPVAAGPTRRLFYFFRVLYRIFNPILLSIKIFNPPTLTLLQVFYCDADCKSLY